MITYEETKIEACEVLLDGVMALALAQDHERCRNVARSMIETLELVISMENGQEAFEKGDIMGIINEMSKCGL